MKKAMKQLLLSLFLAACLAVIAFGQKDTAVVPGYYEAGVYGTLNDAIETAVTNGTINNTVFKLNPYEVYVLNRSIFLDHGQNLEIAAPEPLKVGDPVIVQKSAPPQIVWTEEQIDRAYIIKSYGDVVLKNVWVRYADFFGEKVSSSITFENQNEEADPEIGDFDGCLFDYAGIGAEAGGTITVKADHFTGVFKNCYFRNNSDNHFYYYGRAVSFPFQSSGWHYDSLFFENCTFTNISRIVMQEGNEYGDNVHINHCTVLNTMEWVYQSAGWIRNASITNSIIVNPHMIGYRAIDVCANDQDYDDFLNGLCDPPGGGLINGITAVDSFGFSVPFTNFDRKIFIGNLAYLYSGYLLDWYTQCNWCKEQIEQGRPEELYHPSPMLGEGEIAFIDSLDGDGNKVFKTMNVDWETIYNAEPDFIVEATNQDTMLLWLEYRWNIDVDWSYRPDAGKNRVWPLPENLAYNNSDYQTAAMGGFPLGDLNWFPDLLPSWEAQRDDEWKTINNWLKYGSPNGIPNDVKELPGSLPDEYILQQNYPNPFNPTTMINFSLPGDGFVTLEVYDILGREVAELVNEEKQAGIYSVYFNGANLSSGIYFYSIKMGNYYRVKKMVLAK